jgi:hypothetical protein
MVARIQQVQIGRLRQIPTWCTLQLPGEVNRTVQQFGLSAACGARSGGFIA